jgi:lipopolysaccharide transport protein LptA
VKFFCFIPFFALANVCALPAETNAPAVPHLTRIDSDSVDFDMNTNARTATYYGNVRVDDPQMKLTCAWLVADLPQNGGHINHIVAETNVVIDFTDEKGQTNHATSDKAVYNYNVQGAVTNETVTLTGNARAENAQVILTGEPIIWNRANGGLTATNEHTIFRQNLDNAITRTNAPAANTNSPPRTILPIVTITNIF